MWVITPDGNAVNNNTGEEIYVDYGSDAIFRVYRNHKPINFFTSFNDARDYIKTLADKLNGADDID